MPIRHYSKEEWLKFRSKVERSSDFLFYFYKMDILKYIYINYCKYEKIHVNVFCFKLQIISLFFFNCHCFKSSNMLPTNSLFLYSISSTISASWGRGGQLCVTRTGQSCAPRGGAIRATFRTRNVRSAMTPKSCDEKDGDAERSVQRLRWMDGGNGGRRAGLGSWDSSAVTVKVLR